MNNKNYDMINIPQWFAEFNEAPRYVRKDHKGTILAVILMFLGASCDNFTLSIIMIVASLITIAAALIKEV